MKMSNSPEQAACFAATQALCNFCGRLCDAKIIFQAGKVYLEKWCPDHRESRALICSDVDWYLNSLSYIKPGSEPISRAVDNYTSCPESCGLCPQHQQHTCLPILEITDRCNLKCPICLVSGTGLADLSLEQVRAIVDTLIHYEGRLNMLTVSGGEPTCHPEFLEIIDSVLRPEIGIVSVSTNGLLLDQEKKLLRELCDRNVVISLQFDGFSPDVYKKLRGDASLADVKKRVLDNILSFGGKVSLTVTLAKGVNEGELPEILDFFFSHKEVVSIMIQPVAHAGRAAREFPHDPLDIITIPDVVKMLVQASKGVLTETAFTPLPCSHPSCFALTYLLNTQDNTMVPLPTLLNANDYLDIIKNEALLGTDWDSLAKIKDALYRLWSSDGIIPEQESVLKTIRAILLDLNKIGGNASHQQLLGVGINNIKSIFIHQFMDRATFDLSRAIKCCNHYPQADGRLLPACVRNNCLSLLAGQEGITVKNSITANHKNIEKKTKSHRH